MGDKQDQLALGLELGEKFIQNGAVVVGKGRGDFIEDEDIWIAGEGSHQFHQFLLFHREALGKHIQGHLGDSPIRKGLFGSRPHFPQVHHAAAGKAVRFS